MRFRLGLTTGFAVGYYFGSKAGRERYRQIKGWIDRLRDTEAVETATEKAKAVVDLSVERARDAVEHRREHDTAAPRAGADLSDLDEGAAAPLIDVIAGANGIGG